MKRIALLIVVLVCAFRQLTAKPDLVKNDGEVMRFRSPMEGIVKDLISRWESPLGYLHNRGYIKAPAPDFDNLQKELEAKEVKIHEEQNKREVRSYNKVRDANLKDMFQTLFSSKDNGISDELRSKLNVPWDMTALKQTAHNEANRFYEKFYNKRVEEKTVDDAPIDPAQVDKQVARLYPSVVPNAVRKPIEGKKKMRYIPLSYNNNNNKHGDSLVGLAKLLGSREMMDKGRTLPLPIRFERDEFIVPHQGS